MMLILTYDNLMTGTIGQSILYLFDAFSKVRQLYFFLIDKSAYEKLQNRKLLQKLVTHTGQT